MDQKVIIQVDNNQNDGVKFVKHNQLALAWTDLTFKVKTLFKEKVILNQLTGQVNFGEVTALMGPSGAGKTTLLKCIYGLNQSGLTRESLLFVSKSTRLEPCFLVQDQSEQLMMNLTVRESLAYASVLKNSGIENIDHKKIVERVTDELSLVKCLDTPVKWCSGGEQKRLVIGMELTALNKPNLMCFDEPTTGIDSDAAERLMIVLKELASKHRIAVVVSIHQPNSDILNLTDHLYVLSLFGHCIYDGHSKDLHQHIIDSQISENDWQVPIQGLLKIATKFQVLPDKNIELSPDIRKLTIKTKIKQQNLKTSIQKRGQLLTGRIQSTCRCFYFVGFCHLLRRNFTNYILRDWKYELFQAFLCCVGAIFLVLLFPKNIGEDPDCPPDFINNANLTEITTKIFNSVNGIRKHSDLNSAFLVLFAQFYSLVIFMSMTYKIPSQIKIFLNEKSNGWYLTSSFYLAFNLMHLPILLLTTYLYVWFLYYWTSQLEMISFWQGIWKLPEPFQQFMLFTMVVVIAFQSLSFACGIFCHDNIPKSILSFFSVWLVYYTYSDFMIPINELKSFEQFMGLLSMINLLFRSHITILYGGERCGGDESRILSFFRIEEDKLWVNLELIIWQGLFWRLLGLVLLLWEANNFGDKIKFRKRKKLVDAENTEDLALQVFGNEIQTEDQRSIKVKQSKNLMINSYRVSTALVWQNLTVTYNKKAIFKDFNGIIKFGQITALMGPSGAGKTTLLKAINGMIQKNFSENSKIFLQNERRVRQCFVVQNQKDHLLMDLTVRESLMYSSLLKNSEHKQFNHKENIDKIAEELLLKNCINNVIAKCSGGEQKRLSIAQELTARDKPNLICIDEPTSGLDSCNAEVTIACLQRLAHDNELAVVASIHQPDEEVLTLFDNLYVISADGICIFYGPQDQISNHLSKCEVSCRQWQAPVEELIKLASIRADNENKRQVIINLLSSEANEKIKSELLQLNDLHLGASNANAKSFNLADFFCLLKRHFKNLIVRQWRYQIILFSLIIVNAFNLINNFPKNLGKDPGCLQETINLTNIHLINQPILDAITGFEQRFSQNIKFMYFVVVLIVCISNFVYSYIFFNEIRVFFNEHRNGWYSTASFFFSRNIIELLPLTIITYFFCITVFYGTSQPDLDFWYQAFWNVPQRFVLFVVVISLIAFDSIGYAIFITTIFPKNYAKTILLLFVIGVTFCCLSGNFIPYARLSPFLKVVNYPNHVRMAMESLIIILYANRCQSKPIALNMFEISEDILLTNIITLFIIGILLRLGSYLILRIKVGGKF